MPKERILLVEDEQAIREMLFYTLVKSGYDCIEAGDAGQAGAAIQNDRPDLILMDWMLPGLSGVDYVRRLKGAPDTRLIPVIMLTARGTEDDRVRGLEVGADDYISKPFSTKELLARIKAVLRRCTTGRSGGAASPVRMAALTLDPQTHRVTIGTEEISISPKEFRLLHFFLSRPERVYGRTQLLDQIWGEGAYIEKRTIDVHIRRLRKALAPYGYDHYIQTVHGVGYRFSTHPPPS